MSKYENYLLAWRELDFNCKKLDGLFIMGDTECLTDLEFINLVNQMETCLSKLKNNYGILMPVCFEKKYLEMRDRIVLYEAKLKKFDENYNEKKLITTSKEIITYRSQEKSKFDILPISDKSRPDKNKIATKKEMIYKYYDSRVLAVKHNFLKNRQKTERSNLKNTRLKKFNRKIYENRFLLGASYSNNGDTAINDSKILLNNHFLAISVINADKKGSRIKSISNYFLKKLAQFPVFSIGLIFLLFIFCNIYFHPICCCNYQANYLVFNII